MVLIRKLVPLETSAHLLCHTFAKRYPEAHRGDVVGLAAPLGHNSLNTTWIYIQPTAEKLRTKSKKFA